MLSTLDLASYADIQRLLRCSPQMHISVLGWILFGGAHETNILQRAHRRWGQMTSSMIASVSCTCMCMKWIRSFPSSLTVPVNPTLGILLLVPLVEYIHTILDGGGIVVVLHIYGARSIFLIFFVNQDTEKE